MSKSFRIVLPLFLCAAVPAFAQQNPPPAGAAAQSEAAPAAASQAPTLAPRPAPASDAAEGLIQLDVVVTDKSGKPVTGLGAEDFTLLDNGQPEKIVSFQAFDGITAKPDPPVEVILIIDTVNLSSEQVIHAEREAGRFLRRNGGHLTQPVSIYRLSYDGLSVTPQPSTDGNALAAEIVRKGGLRVILGGQSVYFDSARFPHDYYRNWLSLNALGAMTLEERKRPGRKLMFWIGEGWPWIRGGQDSFDWITEFYTRLREARITLFGIAFSPHPAEDSYPLSYLVGVKSAKEARPANMALNVLAAQSGGDVLDGSTGLADPIIHCVENANAFSTISFDPPRADQPDEYRKLKVQVGKPGLEARTSSGYYDQPVFYDQPYPAGERVTVEQLEQRLEAAHHRPDSELAAELTGMELTERMSGAQLVQWKAGLPGAKSQAALVALADASVFLNPPAAEIPATPPPDLAAQRLMLAKTIDYLSKTIPRLPDFFATRTTIHYRETAQKDQQEQVWKTAMGDRSLHSADISSATVTYRNGYEVVNAETAKGKKPRREDASMNAKGIFGPILSTVIQDAAQSKLAWSRWEEGAGGMRAVFRYAVPQAKSHYEQTYCCLVEGNGKVVLKRLSGYHGEIMVDPDSGAILRMTVQADWPPRMPVLRSDIMVQYGPQEIGGKTYICPVRSVTYWRGRRGVQVHEWGEGFRVYGPFETMLDDVSFGDYHMFRGETRMLTGFDPAPEGKRGDSGTGTAPAAEPKTEP